MAYTTTQPAKRAGVTRAYIRQLCISGALRCEKSGRDWLIQDEEAERFLQRPRQRRCQDKD